VNAGKISFHFAHSSPVHSPVIVRFTGSCDAVFTAETLDVSPPPELHAAATTASTATATAIVRRILDLLLDLPIGPYASSSCFGFTARHDSYGDISLRLGTSEQSILRHTQCHRDRAQHFRFFAELRDRDRRVGEAFLSRVSPFIFDGSKTHTPEAILAQVKAVKDMIDAKMADRGQERRNVKLGRGGIREIEFIVQAAQILCGGGFSDLRERNTMAALAKLARRRLLSVRDRQALERAYVFLRDIEHKLQMVHDLQTHALPDLPDELARCAIRLGYSAGNRRKAGQRFLADHRRHRANVHRIFRSLFDVPGRSSFVKAARKLS